MALFLRFLKGEIYKIFHCRLFLIVAAIWIVLVILDGCLAYRTYADNLRLTLDTIPTGQNGAFQDYPFLQIYSLYNSWIGARVNQPIPLIFFYTMPVYTVIPYSWSYLSEKRSGYRLTMISKMGRLPYYLGKYISVFLSGVCTVLIPLLVSFTFVACLIPAYKPDVNFALYYQVQSTDLLGNLYYMHPLAASALDMGIICFFAGCWAAVTYAVSLYVNNPIVALFSPYLVLLYITATAEQAQVYRSYVEVSIFDYLQLSSPSGIQSVWVLLGEMLFLLIVPFLATCLRGLRNDVL